MAKTPKSKNSKSGGKSGKGGYSFGKLKRIKISSVAVYAAVKPI